MFSSILTLGAGAVTAPAPIDRLMLTGFLAAFAALMTWVYSRRSRRAALVFAIALAVLAYYCFAVGAWLAGLVALVGAWTTIWFHARALRSRLDRWWMCFVLRNHPAERLALGQRASDRANSGYRRRDPANGGNHARIPLGRPTGWIDEASN